ncbi:hypothetical protein [Brasilonema sp. UFV-L1]
MYMTGCVIPCATTFVEYCWLATLYNLNQCFSFVTDLQTTVTAL